MSRMPVAEFAVPILLPAVAVALLWVPAVVAAQAGDVTTVTTPGIHQLTLPGSGRRYTLAIPVGYTGQDTTPLIVSLHYGGQVTPYYGRGLLESLIEPALRSLNAIVVAPDSAAGNWANSTSEQHVLELIDQIQAVYNIDAEKTLLAGYSMGGSGTWYLAPRHPARFRAALVMAGRPQADSTAFDWTTPLYVIHSVADEVAPLNPTQAAVDLLQDQGAPVHLVVADDITHYEISRYRSLLSESIPWIRQAWAE